MAGVTAGVGLVAGVCGTADLAGGWARIVALWGTSEAAVEGDRREGAAEGGVREAAAEGDSAGDVAAGAMGSCAPREDVCC
jgi:hypothetical protein